MAKGFLQRWFGGRSDPPAHLAEVVADLETLARARPSLQEACDVLGGVLAALFTEGAVEAIPTLTKDAAHAKLTEGIPLLRGISLALDAKGLVRRWSAVGAALKPADAAALKEATLDPSALLSEVLAGRPEAVSAEAEARGIDPALVATVLRLTALPALAMIARGLVPVRAEVRWDHGFCPTCGSWPLLAEARGLEQLRFLRCGLCATAWEHSQFRCVYCGNDDHRGLAYLHVEGEVDRYRAATCDACRGYLKVISTLHELTDPQLLVTDLATLHLDLTAADRGFFVAATG